MPLSPRLQEKGVPQHLQGLHQYWFETPKGLDIECWLSYCPAEPIDPHRLSHPSIAKLLHAFVSTHDVTEILSGIMRDIIEFRARACFEQATVEADV